MRRWSSSSTPSGAAGAHGNDRQTVIAHVFGTRKRNSVIGRYSVQSNGETTLSQYGVDRVSAGRPVFLRAVPIGSPAP